MLVNRSSGLSVNVLDGTTGADRRMLNTTGISGGTYPLSQIAVASDGAIHAANLVTPSGASNPFRIYRWANETYGTVPALVYSGDVVGSTRWGDNMEIRGAGNNTQILFGEGGSGVGERIAVFTTSDNGASFAPTTMTVSGHGFAKGASRGGVAFGPDDTFYVKDASGTTLFHGSFDLASSSAIITASGTLGGALGASGFSAMARDWTTPAHRNLLAGLN